MSFNAITEKYLYLLGLNNVFIEKWKILIRMNYIQFNSSWNLFTQIQFTLIRFHASESNLNSFLIISLYVRGDTLRIVKWKRN